jgi:hypothetical protein
MRKIILSFALAAALVPPAFEGFAQDRAEAPAYRQGDFWQLRVGRRIYEASFTGGKVKLFEPKPDQRVEVEGGLPEGLRSVLTDGQKNKEKCI